jgi:hypothetical protein
MGIKTNTLNRMNNNNIIGDTMKTLNDLKLCPKAKAKVELWLKEWIVHFTSLADGRQGNVYHADFEKMNIFYFTDCKDLVSLQVEGRGQENNKSIIKRKRMILFQLLLRVLAGEEVGRKITCTHCGFDDVYIGSCPSGGGHYLFCKKCGKTDVCTYPEFYNTTMDEVQIELTKLGLLK